MRTLLSILAILSLAGAGCLSTESTPLTVKAGDTVSIQQTVLGVGGKVTELFGLEQLTQTAVLGARDPAKDGFLKWKKADDWQSGAMIVDTGASQFYLSSAQYDGLLTDGKATMRLGLLDETISGALAWTDSVKSFLASVDQPVPDLPSATDVLTIAITDAHATAWIRIDGTLKQVDAIKASNWFAEYTVLKNADSPIVLAVTLRATAAASFKNALRGFEISEIKTASP